ncbi:hypothetical protein AVEN_190245-1 [Araneus ventricosus]|uniref:Uncharacterized protein n=1 Tax=Araneus ventricosus TaxID=182803 RepID=A0A4Y2M5J3_ARAVE|nr:hypothetical protein AVEN_190245-1 [Araneus ventricosus]
MGESLAADPSHLFDLHCQPWNEAPKDFSGLCRLSGDTCFRRLTHARFHFNEQRLECMKDVPSPKPCKMRRSWLERDEIFVRPIQIEPSVSTMSFPPGSIIDPTGTKKTTFADVMDFESVRELHRFQDALLLFKLGRSTTCPPSSPKRTKMIRVLR